MALRQTVEHFDIMLDPHGAFRPGQSSLRCGGSISSPEEHLPTRSLAPGPGVGLWAFLHLCFGRRGRGGLRRPCRYHHPSFPGLADRRRLWQSLIPVAAYYSQLSVDRSAIVTPARAPRNGRPARSSPCWFSIAPADQALGLEGVAGAAALGAVQFARRLADNRRPSPLKARWSSRRATEENVEEPKPSSRNGQAFSADPSGNFEELAGPPEGGPALHDASWQREPGLLPSRSRAAVEGAGAAGRPGQPEQRRSTEPGLLEQPGPVRHQWPGPEWPEPRWSSAEVVGAVVSASPELPVSEKSVNMKTAPMPSAIGDDKGDGPASTAAAAVIVDDGRPTAVGHGARVSCGWTGRVPWSCCPGIDRSFEVSSVGQRPRSSALAGSGKETRPDPTNVQSVLQESDAVRRHSSTRPIVSDVRLGILMNGYRLDPFDSRRLAPEWLNDRPPLFGTIVRSACAAFTERAMERPMTNSTSVREPTLFIARSSVRFAFWLSERLPDDAGLSACRPSGIRSEYYSTT